MKVELRKEYRAKLHQRTLEIAKERAASCQYGGCHNHGQEFCNLDAAWDSAEDQAKEELYDLYEEAFG